MRLARILGTVGMFLIWIGSITLLFVAFQLWGTNIAEARAQGSLESEFDDKLEALGISASEALTTTTTVPDGSVTTTTTLPLPPPEGGDAIARIVIPRIGVDKIVVEGVARGDLRKGPGHFPSTPMPGQTGNAAIAGHRTTYGAPFHRIDELEVGDEILVATLQGTFVYEVAAQEIVRPTNVEVIEDQGDNRLTLTSCHPKFSARERIVVIALLADDAAPAAPTVADVEPVTADVDENDATLDVGVGAETTVDTLDGDETGPVEPVAAWGMITLAVWIAFFLLSRRWRRIPAYLLGAPVFGLSLFIWFGTVAELLPSNF